MKNKFLFYLKGIELFSKLDTNKYHGLIVGPSDGKESYFNSLNQKVEDLGLSNNITFTGSRNDINNILLQILSVLALVTSISGITLFFVKR